MKHSIMEALFNGRVAPWERRSPMSSERRGIEERIQQENQYFMEKLSFEDGKRLELLENLYSDAARDEEIDIYSHGFALGALLMLEIMEKRADMIGK